MVAYKRAFICLLVTPIFKHPEVREALAEQLKLPASSCRLVERVGASGAFASFRDSERIQGRRALLVMGVESLKAPEEREMEQREEERRFAAETPLKRQALALQAPRKVRQLTLQEALALQRDLIQGFSKPEGVFDMMQQFVGGEFDYDPEFQRQGSILTGLLFSEDAAPEAKSSKKAKPSEPVLDVEVVVRHAVEEVRARRNARSAKAIFDRSCELTKKTAGSGETLMMPNHTMEPPRQHQKQVFGRQLKQHLGVTSDEAIESDDLREATIESDDLREAALFDMTDSLDEDWRDGGISAEDSAWRVSTGHADEEARVTVKSNSTMKQVKDALAAYLDRPELLKAVRVVYPVGDSGAFASYKDSEKLQGRRFLLAIGLDSLSQRKPAAQVWSNRVSRYHPSDVGSRPTKMSKVCHDPLRSDQVINAMLLTTLADAQARWLVTVAQQLWWVRTESNMPWPKAVTKPDAVLSLADCLALQKDLLGSPVPQEGQMGTFVIMVTEHMEAHARVAGLSPQQCFMVDRVFSDIGDTWALCDIKRQGEFGGLPVMSFGESTEASRHIFQGTTDYLRVWDFCSHIGALGWGVGSQASGWWVTMIKDGWRAWHSTAPVGSIHNELTLRQIYKITEGQRFLAMAEAEHYDNPEYGGNPRRLDVWAKVPAALEAMSVRMQVAFWNAIPASLKLLTPARSALCMLGQIATPLQSAWVALHQVQLHQPATISTLIAAEKALLHEGQIYEVTLQSKRQQKLIDEQHTMLKIPSGSFMQHIWQWLALSRAAEVRVQERAMGRMISDRAIGEVLCPRQKASGKFGSTKLRSTRKDQQAKASKDSPVPQLATDDVKANSRGLAIVNVTEALPFLKTQSSISPDALGLLTTQPLPTELTATDVQYPAINSQEAIILQGTLIDIGDVHISKKIEKSEQAIEAVDTVIIKIVGFRDELEEALQICRKDSCAGSCRAYHPPVEEDINQDVWGKSISEVGRHLRKEEAFLEAAAKASLSADPCDTAKSNPTALAAGTSTSNKLAQLESQLKEDVRDAINTEMTNRQTDADMGNGRIGALETAVGEQPIQIQTAMQTALQTMGSQFNMQFQQFHKDLKELQVLGMGRGFGSLQRLINFQGAARPFNKELVNNIGNYESWQVPSDMGYSTGWVLRRPTYSRAVAMTDHLMTTITKELALAERANGWIKCQDLANHQWGQAVQCTCKNGTRRDFVYMSPEAAAICHGAAVTPIFMERRAVTVKLAITVARPVQAVERARTAIFGDYHANFRHFETWRIRKRSQIIADRYASNQQMIYPEVDQLQQTYHYTVLAHEVDTGLTHLDKAVAHDPPEAGWELEGETVQVAEVEDDVVQLNSTSEPQPGTTITSTRTISEEGQLQETFQSEWHLPADLWERAIAFRQNFLPKGNLADDEITDAEWKAALPRLKPTAAKGPNAKKEQASEVLDYRPVTIYAILYRLWLSTRARAALRHLEQYCDFAMYGFLPGREAAQYFHEQQATAFSFVDNFSAQASSSATLFRSCSHSARCGSCSQVLRRPWPGHETKERKALDLPVVTKLKDLPTSPSSAGRQPNKHTQDRSRKLQREWDLLRRLPAPYPIKLEALYVKFWPSMFYGMAIAQVTDEEVAQLRTTATKALQAHRAGSNPMLRLSLSSNMQADPGVALQDGSFRLAEQRAKSDATCAGDCDRCLIPNTARYICLVSESFPDCLTHHLIVPQMPSMDTYLQMLRNQPDYLDASTEHQALDTFSRTGRAVNLSTPDWHRLDGRCTMSSSKLWWLQDRWGAWCRKRHHGGMCLDNQTATLGICVDGWNRLNAGNLRYDAIPNGELWERLANLLKHSENDLRLEKVYSHVQHRTTALQDWEYVNNGAADVAAKATVYNRPPELLACHARLHDQGGESWLRPVCMTGQPRHKRITRLTFGQLRAHNLRGCAPVSWLELAVAFHLSEELFQREVQPDGRFQPFGRLDAQPRRQGCVPDRERRTLSSDPRKFSMERQKLFLTVQTKAS
ncbi:unnamed protein product [Effrenium voratum]|nr:unnamed protein product [Effrenium voratum]